MTKIATPGADSAARQDLLERYAWLAIRVGIHLEPIIEPTVNAFAAAPGRLLPAHCTGWKAVHQLARALPDTSVQPAVGTVVTF